MGTLSETYKSVKPAVIAFVARISPTDDPAERPKFPHIIGTAFVVDERGIVATNQHVVDAFAKAPTYPGEPPVAAVAFVDGPNYRKIIPVPKLREMVITEFDPGENYSGPERPDIALVKIGVRDLPALELETAEVSEGDEVATTGFPLGTMALISPDGRLEKMTPTLQRGIISAVLPFACPNPHTLMLNIMVQGGASGSPVFNTATGKVVGIICERRFDTTLPIPFPLPTNFSIAVPARHIHDILAYSRTQADFMSTEGIPTLEELKMRTARNIHKDSGFRYVPGVTVPPDSYASHPDGGPTQ